MNDVIGLDAIAARAPSPVRSAALHRSHLPDTITLGMPHLSANGLSEIWLLKELGHRHWFMLAELAGLRAPEFRDAKGAAVYAAFCAVSITGGAFDTVRENDVLTVTSGLSLISRTQAASRHELAVGARAIGTVEMVSTFVSRAAGGGNHTVARVELGVGLPVAGPRRHPLAELAAAFRANHVDAHLGFELGSAPEIACFTFDPCPSQDFNGAGFLYFTSFLAFVDRAEWAFDRRHGVAATTVRRDVFFRANIDPGEAIRVVWCDFRRTDCGFAHRCRIERGGDGAVLADVFSIRSLGSGR